MTFRLLILVLLATVTLAKTAQPTGFDRIREHISNNSDTVYRFPVDHFQAWIPKVRLPEYRPIQLTPQECGWRAFAYSYMACNAPCQDFAYLLELVCEGDTDAINLPYLYTACCKNKLKDDTI